MEIRMAKSAYIIATEARSGKSLIALGLLQFLLRGVRRVAFFRPVIQDPEAPDTEDPDITLMRAHFGLEQSYEDSYAYTLTQAKELINSGKQEMFYDTVIDKCRALQEKFDFVLCMSTDLTSKNEVFEFDLNTEIAANLGAPVLLVSMGRDKTAKEVTASTRISLDLLKEKSVDLLGCVVNRATMERHEFPGVREELSAAVAKDSGQPFPVYIIPEDPPLARPTVAEVAAWMNAEVLYGGNRLDTPVNRYVIAAMHIGNYLSWLQDADLVITPGDREDILLASMVSHMANNVPEPSAVMLNGGIPLPISVRRLIEGLADKGLPILQVPDHTYSVVTRLDKLYSRIRPGDMRKINNALALFERHIDTVELGRRIGSSTSSKVTPKMFEFTLIARAKRHKMRIVLPEGEEERILRATEILYQREVADIILLGDPKAIKAKARALGLQFDVPIINPGEAPEFDDYVETYQELRKKKGTTRGMARDAMLDATYFATMMVYKDHADGMVSGAINTTAHTIRPALEFIKTKPGVSLVSSTFFMCLKDKVLAFADCAVNPNPTPEQLATIAISTAHTATLFGIEPRVAMLSYSTGASGKGADVDLVVEATRIAKEMAPDLLLEGPIQYDAAVDMGVAKTKLPDSQVAGRATVLIFPDLNTGNNTYKAVQRSANAVAVGPVLQGLNKPVNDLSRGGTVPDIVNTVAITAIQAQAEADAK